VGERGRGQTGEVQARAASAGAARARAVATGALLTTAGANRRWRATVLVRQAQGQVCILSRTLLQPNDFCTKSNAKHSTARESAASRRVHSMKRRRRAHPLPAGPIQHDRSRRSEHAHLDQQCVGVREEGQGRRGGEGGRVFSLLCSSTCVL
jgi:hypothetical protein